MPLRMFIFCLTTMKIMVSGNTLADFVVQNIFLSSSAPVALSSWDQKSPGGLFF